MSFIISFGIGVGISIIIAVPFVFWAKKIGKQAYVNSRVRGMKGKMLDSALLHNLTHVEYLPQVKNSKYWNLMNKSDNREEYERKLEELFSSKYETLKRLSDEKTKKFFRTYFELRNKIDDIKLIFYCVENNRDRDELKTLLNSHEHEDLLDYLQISEIINHLIQKHNWNFLNMKDFNKNGLPALEYALEDYFFNQLRKNSKEKPLNRMYKRIRKNYLLQQILRLKKQGKHEREIIELLKISKKPELELVKKDLNLVLKDLSKEDETIRQMKIMGQDNNKIFNYYFKNTLMKFTKKEEKLQGPFNIGSTFYLLLRIRREIDSVKNMWVIQ